MEAKLSIVLLGGFEAKLDGQPLGGFDSDKVRALLVYLIVEQSVHRREKLAGLFWSELPEKRARHNLSQAIYNLRRILNDKNPESECRQPLLVVTHQDIQFNADGEVSLDLVELHRGLEGCPAHSPTTTRLCDDCMETLSAVIDVYKGEFLEGFSLPDCPEFEAWSIVERERFHRSALSSFVALASWHRRMGNRVEAQRFARHAVALDPLWEPAHRQLMHCLWLSGNQSEALAQYETCRQVLATELGVDPEERTQKLAQRIKADVEVASPSPSGQQRLPHPITAFIGRKRELQQIQELLLSPSCRLLTLLGPGGSGKTRLAIEAARQLIDEFPDGVYLVPLSGLESTLSLVPAIAEIVGLPIHEDRDPESQLFDYFRQKQLLIIMDSYETVVDGVGVAVSILREAPLVKILATSRAPLNAKGEHRLSVKGMRLPIDASSPDAIDYDTVRLFVSAGKRLHPGYSPSAANLEAIVRICRLVGGMPLGIILSSAWLNMLSPAAIADAIEESLDFLAVDWSDLPPRQRSQRATLEYTWRLIDQREREQFRALSVCVGGFTFMAAAAIANISKMALHTFIDNSLIQRVTDDRYLMHDLLRQFAAEKLAENPTEQVRARQRHSQFYLGLLAKWDLELKSANQQSALELMDVEHANLQTASEYAIRFQDSYWSRNSANALFHYYELRVRNAEGKQLCNSTLESLKSADDHPEKHLFLLWASVWLARFNRLLGNEKAAEAIRRKCEEQFYDLASSDKEIRELQAFLCREMGEANYHLDRREAKAAFSESLGLYRQLRNDWGAANSLVGLAGVTRYLDELDEAVRLAEEGLAIFRAVGDPKGIARALNGLGQSLNRVGRWNDGEQCIREMIDIYGSIGDRHGMANGLLNLGRAYIWHGRFDEAIANVQQSLTMLIDLGLMLEQALAVTVMAIVCYLQGEFRQSRSYGRRALELGLEVDFPRAVAGGYWSLGVFSVSEKDYGQAREYLGKAEGVFRDLASLDDMAPTLAAMSYVEIKSGEMLEAKIYLREALEIVAETRGVWSASFTMPIAALYLIAQEKVEKAVEVFSLIWQYPIPANSKYFNDIVGQEVKRASAAMPPAIVAAAEERGRKGDPFEMAAELLEELTS